MAVTGWTSRLSLTEWLVAHDPSLGSAESGSVKRLWHRLTTTEFDESDPLVEQYAVTIDRDRHFHVSMVRLSTSGRELMNEMGLPITTVLEWDRLFIRHHALHQPVHTAMVILAAHYFRRHGFWTQVCPRLEWPLAPDILLVDPASERRLYVEVEAPQATGKVKELRLRRKWELQKELQGFVCLCALNPRQKAQRLRSATHVVPDGFATDLRSLSHAPGTLWTTAWGSFARHNPYAGRSTDQTPAIQGAETKGGRTPVSNTPPKPVRRPPDQSSPARSSWERGPVKPAATPSLAPPPPPPDQSDPAQSSFERGPVKPAATPSWPAPAPSLPPPSQSPDQPDPARSSWEREPVKPASPPSWPRPRTRTSSW